MTSRSDRRRPAQVEPVGVPARPGDNDVPTSAGQRNADDRGKDPGFQDDIDGQTDTDGGNGSELWCDGCQTMVDSDDLDEDGCCQTCGTHVGGPRKVPLKFKLMIFASVIYLGYRAYQGISWVLHHV